MSDATPKPLRPAPRLRRLRRALIFLLAFALLGLWYLTSESFERWLRARFVAGLETATGGNVELDRFRWSLWNLTIEAGGLIVRGREPVDEAPLLRVQSVLVRLKVLSFLGRRLGVREVRVERPMVHVITLPDGSTNWAGAQSSVPAAPETQPPLAVLFDLELDRLAVTGGELRWNQRRIPLEFVAEDVTAGLRPSAPGQFSGEIAAGKVLVRYSRAPALPLAARAEFHLQRSSVELVSLKASSASSWLDLNGSLQNFHAPVAEFAYAAKLEAAELGAALASSEWSAGHVLLEGKGSYGHQGIASAGALRWSGVTWRRPGFRLAGLSGSSEFSLEAERLTASRISAQLFGGTVGGSAEVTHWVNWDKSGPQAGRAKLHLARLQIGRIAESVAGPAMPLDRLHVAGTADGTLNLAWKGTPANASAEFALEVTPPADRPGQIPLAGSARGIYRATPGTLQLEPSWLAARKTRLEASGTLGRPASEMQLALATGDLSELLPALHAAGFALPLEIEPRGHASFHGQLSGPLAALRASGKVAAFDVGALLSRPPRTPGAVPQGPLALRADAISFLLNYSPELAEARNGVLHQGTARLQFEAVARLRQGRFDAQAPFSARLQLRGADLAGLQSMLGTSLPLTGQAEMALRLAGSWDAPAGEGSLRLAPGTIFGEPFASLTASLKFGAGEIALTGLRLAHNGGSYSANVTGDAAWRFDDGRFRLNLEGSGIDLAKLKGLQRPRWSLQGQAAFTLQGSGTLSEPEVAGNLVARNLVLNGKEAGDLEADAATRNGVLHMKARSRFRQAELALDGAASLRGDWPAKIFLRFFELDVDPLLRTFFQGRLTGHSRIAGTAEVRGPLRRPRSLSLEAVVEHLALDVENVQLGNRGPLRFAVVDQTLEVRRFHIVGASTNLSVSGKVELAGERRLALDAHGGLDLRLLQSLDPDVQSQGATAISVAVRGTAASPQLEGNVRIAGGALSFIDLPNALSDINGELVFNENRLQVQSLSARSGGGRLDLAGYITYARGYYFNLTAVGQDIRLRYPPGISSMADASLRFVGSSAGSQLSGEITVTRFGVSPGFDLAAYLARARRGAGLPRAGSALDNLRLEVRLVSTPELQVETSLARLSGDLDLRLRGSAAHPSLLGRVNLTEGRILFNGTEYQLMHGAVTFSSPAGIVPVLDLTAAARVRQYDIEIRFHGSADRSSINYRSDPPLPTSDIIALLALGRTHEEAVVTRQVTETPYDSASSALLAQALNLSLTSRMQKLFGVSRIKIDPQVGGPENNPNARLTIEQQVSNDVTLTYITNLSQSSQQIVQAEVAVSKAVSVVAVRDQNGVLGFEIRIRQRKR